MRARFAALLLLAMTACAAQPSTPADVVDAYFASLGRDPIRSLPLTTEAFHRAHGLSLVTTAEARDWRGGSELPAAREPEPVDRAQVAWLAIQNRPEFSRVATAFTAVTDDVQQSGDAATVTVTVTAARRAPFVQIFHLVRSDRDAPWQIDAIEQQQVRPDNETAAFIAHPTERARRVLAERARALMQPRGNPR